jgi:hypothetical protein
MKELFFSLQDDLDSVCRKFKHPKVTLIVRAPELPDGDVVIGNDDLDEAIGAINRLKARTPVMSPTPPPLAPVPTTREEAAAFFARYGNVGEVRDLLRTGPTVEQLLAAGNAAVMGGQLPSTVDVAVSLIQEKGVKHHV